MLNLVVEGPPEGLSLSEIARAVGMSKSSALATARTLATFNYLRDSEPGPRYKPGMALIRLGDLTTRQQPLGEVCMPILRELAHRTGMTARAAMSEGGHPVFVARVDGPGTVRFHTPLGAREAPHSTAAGKAILATLNDAEVAEICEESGLPATTSHTIIELPNLLDELALTRERGFAVDDEEDADGVFCIGAAFFDHSGRCAGALSVTGIKVDLPARRVLAVGKTVRDLADEVSVLLGGRAYSAHAAESRRAPRPN